MSQNHRHSARDPRVPSARAARPAGNLQQLRAARGLTIEQLATLAAIDAQALRELEEGSLAPSIKLLWSLANALNVPFSSLVQDASRPAAPRAGDASGTRLRSVAPREARESGARRSLLPSGARHGPATEVHELKLAPLSVETGASYPRGARETVLVTAGEALVRAAGRDTVLHTGQSAELDAHGERAYLNPHAQPALLYIMVTPAGER